MRIFSIECSATAASVAISDDNKLLGEFFTNTGLTHSQTLLPMVQNLLKCSNIEFDSIDAFAIAAGPGSFTGVRIGIAAIKGLAFPNDKPCISVSSLEATAYNLLGKEYIVCSVMDARCNQVYTATFKCGKEIERITQDDAIMIDELLKNLKNYKLPIVFVGDGAELCYNNLNGKIDNISIAPVNLRYQRASSVSYCAYKKIEAHGTQSMVSADEILPIYLRVPQAERELKKRMDNKQ
ncbi:MAG: tRNA (adenosine(37)-N6)-threonylcarbamoyltransferase complex dimerization subunit type 1 TsaB [Oscillospiraceae bacterium]